MTIPYVHVSFAAALSALSMAALAPAAYAEEIPLSKARIFFELNHTDGDIGIHGAVGGDPWRWLRLEDPNERRIMAITLQGRLQRQGLSEFTFESAEPTFDELPPAVFFARFPAGTYEYEGRSLDGEELEGEAELSHVIPAPVGNVLVAGEPAAENCDAELPSVSAPVTIAWDPVTMNHPDLGIAGTVDVAHYEFVLELPGNKSLKVELGSDVTEFEIPAALLELSDEFKFEILARATTGNQTSIESCFAIE